ncbi:MAG: AAA domain-containing protein [Hyphomicrobiales bacterium]
MSDYPEINFKLFYNEIIKLSEIDEDQTDNGFVRLRYLLEQLFFEITSNEGKFFSGLYSRISFSADQYNFPYDLINEAHTLRRLTSKDNQVDIKNIQELWLPALKSFLYIINVVNNTGEYPDTLLDTPYASSIFNKSNFKRKSSYNRLTLISIISDEAEDIDYPTIIAEDIKSGQTIYIQLRDIVYDNGIQANGNGQISMNINTKIALGQQFSILPNILDTSTVFNAYNLYQIEGSASEYYTGHHTLIVIEPDYLMDASDLAECFQFKEANPYLYFLRLLAPSKTTEAMVKGSIVNTALDLMIQEPETTAWDVTKKGLKDMLTTCINFPPNFSNSLTNDLLELHWQNLQEFVYFHRDKNLRIEPSFFSSNYGIQGRLDIMSEEPDDPTRKDIIELKSGRAPNHSAWKNNQYQVIAYQMLLNSNFGDKRRGNSSIFYSRAEESALRDIPFYFGNMQNLMMVRNMIIAVVRKSEQGKFDYSTLPERIARYEVPKFSVTELKEFSTLFYETDQLTLDYYYTFLTFIFRELIANKTGSLSNPNRSGVPFSSLWKDNFKTKKDNFSIIPDLKVIKYDQDNGQLHFSRLTHIISNYRKGDMILLYSYENEKDNPLNKEILKGNIMEINNDIIIVGLRNKQVDQNYFSANKRWALEKDFYEKNNRSTMQSLFRFAKHSNKKRRAKILGQTMPDIGRKIFYKPEFGTDTQVELIQKIISSPDYFLLQGPPGTGKTSAILANLVKYYSVETSKSILLLAFTNKAIDQICEKLDKTSIDFVRLNHSITNPEWSLQERTRDMNFLQSQSYLRKGKVYVSTIATWQNKGQDILKFKKFSTVIVDEASQLAEPDLSGILIDFEKFIMIGDQNQLPAVVVQSEDLCKCKTESLNEIGIKDLRTSLFDRLFSKCKEEGWTHAYGTLTDHFRMHRDIANSINHYYNNQLKEYLDLQREEWKLPVINNHNNDMLACIESSRMVYIESSTSTNIKTHPEEASIVVKLLDALYSIYGSDMNEETVGVISPFRAQINEIQTRINNKPYARYITIDTVERYQGSEKEHIIFTTTVASELQMRSLLSLSSDGLVDRKLNVAISRAKQQFIMVGDRELLSTNLHYYQLISHIEQYGFAYKKGIYSRSAK